MNYIAGAERGKTIHVKVLIPHCIPHSILGGSPSFQASAPEAPPAAVALHMSLPDPARNLGSQSSTLCSKTGFPRPTCARRCPPPPSAQRIARVGPGMQSCRLDPSPRGSPAAAARPSSKACPAAWHTSQPVNVLTSAIALDKDQVFRGVGRQFTMCQQHILQSLYVLAQCC